MFEIVLHFSRSSSPNNSCHDDDAEASIRTRRHRLFRNILDRHKFILTDEAREQIRVSQVILFAVTCKAMKNLVNFCVFKVASN